MGSSKNRSFSWRWVLLGLALSLVILVGLSALRIFSFSNEVSGKRVGDALPTADGSNDARATLTSQALLCAASQDCKTAPVETITATPRPTPDLARSNAVQRLKAGERINLLYMGYGIPNKQGQFLTDSLLVLSYDPRSQAVLQFNVPRDFFMTVVTGVNKSYKTKVNNIFADFMDAERFDTVRYDAKYKWTNQKEKHEAGANLVANNIQNLLGLKIDYWMSMNFDGFKTLIEKIGGVNVCVERDFVDYKYPKNDDASIDASVITVKFDKGCQRMSGERAIQFARSRQSESIEGGDFARSRRQMKVIAGLKDEVLKQGILTNAFSIMDALQENFKVSMGLDELYALASYFNSGEGKELATNVKFSSEIIDGNNLVKEDRRTGFDYVLIPILGEDRFADLQSFTKRALTFAPLRREQVRIQVLNASNLAGKGNALTDYLADQGFRLAAPENAATQPTTILYDYSNGAAPISTAVLKKYLPALKVMPRKPEEKPYDGAPDMLLFIGTDYKGVAAANIDLYALQSSLYTSTGKPIVTVLP